MNTYQYELDLCLAASRYRIANNVTADQALAIVSSWSRLEVMAYLKRTRK